MKFKIPDSFSTVMNGSAYAAVQNKIIIAIQTNNPPTISKQDAIRTAWRKNWCQYAKITQSRMQKRSDEQYRENLILKMRKLGVVFVGQVSNGFFEGERVID